MAPRCSVTCHGYIELIGWNRYGGWRIGIRDVNNNYHYFAHLNGFRKGLKKGMIPLSKVKRSEVSAHPVTAHLELLENFRRTFTSGSIGLMENRLTLSDPYTTLRTWEKETKKRMQKKKSG